MRFILPSLSDRLALLKTRFGGWAGLSRATGVQAGTLRLAARRGSEMTVSALAQIVEGTGCNRAWLESGEGQAFPNRPTHQAAEDAAKYSKPQVMEIVFEVPLDLRPGQKIMGIVRLRPDKH